MINTKPVQKILGALLALFSTTMLPPLAISVVYRDGMHSGFLAATAIILAVGFALYYPVRQNRDELRLRDGFMVVVLFWTVLGTFGAVPLLLANDPQLSAADAIFESISGLTTTGATVISGLDRLPPSILFYRQLLQWLGGMGIIVLAVAIVPMLGIGGMQLYRAETPGPVKDSKLTPRITETAKALWVIYLTLTITCTLAYFACGMSLFDAVGHAFSTVSIGGFSTHDDSLGYFDNAFVEAVAVLFMLIAGANFSLHFVAWRSQSLRGYFEDAECRVYLRILAATTLVCAVTLAVSATMGPLAAFRAGLFHAVSIGTTTGFTTETFSGWPSFLPVLLLFAAFVGGCAGSTGGGLKVIRVALLFKQGMREIKRLIHPSAVITIQMGGRAVPTRVIDSVWGFFATYVAVFGILMVLVMATGMDQVTAFSAVAASLNNLGPGLGDVALHYGEVSDPAKLILCLAMLLGRLEIFTLLVLLTPAFWRG